MTEFVRSSRVGSAGGPSLRRPVGYEASPMSATPSPTEQVARVSAAVYGTILVLALVGALSEIHRLDAVEILGGTLVTSLVFWLAHVYAEVLARGVSGDRRSLGALARAAARDEWPLVEAAVLPAAPLFLGALGVLSESTAVTLALGAGLADLFGWGYLAGRAADQGPLRAATSALLAVGLGTVMVLLKGLLH
jgi:hypothetical protein